MSVYVRFWVDLGAKEEPWGCIPGSSLLVVR